MVWLAGVDGCRAGWVLVQAFWDGANLTRWEWSCLPEIGALDGLARRPHLLALDMPIGLFETPQKGGRLCDRLVRKALGPRRASVFSPPARCVFDEPRFRSGLGVSIQAYHLTPKIREVDAWIDVHKQRWCFEAHPEWAFACLAGAPAAAPKRTLAGFRERLAALEAAAAGFAPWFHSLGRLGPGIQRDDLLDACVLVHTARRRVLGLAERAPVEPPRDARGLLMEIWA